MITLKGEGQWNSSRSMEVPVNLKDDWGWDSTGSDLERLEVVVRGWNA